MTQFKSILFIAAHKIVSFRKRIQRNSGRKWTRDGKLVILSWSYSRGIDILYIFVRSPSTLLNNAAQNVFSWSCYSTRESHWVLCWLNLLVSFQLIFNRDGEKGAWESNPIFADQTALKSDDDDINNDGMVKIPVIAKVEKVFEF